MKKILLFAVSLFAATFSNGQYGQKAITLTDDNVQLQSGTIHEHSASVKKVKLPSTGSKATWNYSGLTGGSAITYGYLSNVGKNRIKAFSNNAAIDTGLFEQFDSSFGDTYPTSYVFDEDSKGLFFAGFNTPRFPSYLQTGYTDDSLVIEQQTSCPSKRVNVIQFPATNNSSWSSNYTMTTHWHVTLDELGWSNVEATEVEYTMVKDNIVGYGDLKIPTTKSYNQQNEFDALMDKHSLITIDSIFVGPVPTDAFGLSWPLGYPTAAWQVAQYNKLYPGFVDTYVGTIEYVYLAVYGLTVTINPIDPYGLLLSNGVTQGMPTYTDYSEIFYTQNSFRPAITFDFGADNSYSTIAGIVYNQDITGDGNGNKGCRYTEGSNLRPWRCSHDFHKHDYKSVQLTGNKFGHAGSNAQVNGGSGNATGLQSDLNASTQFSVYPNPLVNSSALNCSMLKNSDATWTICIMNMIGQVVETVPVSAQGKLNIPILLNENMKSGLYIVNVSDETGQRVGLSKVNVISASN